MEPKRPLVTNDNYFLRDLSITGIDAMTPRAFLARAGGPHLDAGGAIENADVELRDRNPVVPEP